MLLTECTTGKGECEACRTLHKFNWQAVISKGNTSGCPACSFTRRGCPIASTLGLWKQRRKEAEEQARKSQASDTHDLPQNTTSFAREIGDANVTVQMLRSNLSITQGAQLSDIS